MRAGKESGQTPGTQGADTCSEIGQLEQEPEFAKKTGATQGRKAIRGEQTLPLRLRERPETEAKAQRKAQTAEEAGGVIAKGLGVQNFEDTGVDVVATVEGVDEPEKILWPEGESHGVAAKIPAPQIDVDGGGGRNFGQGTGPGIALGSAEGQFPRQIFWIPESRGSKGGALLDAKALF